MADKRKGYKHGDFIEGDPNPHVDTYKYKDRQTGKITSHKVEGSEMKVSKKQQAGLGQLARRKSKNIKPTIIKLDVGKDGKNIFKVVESKTKGGRASLKGGGRAYGKNS